MRRYLYYLKIKIPWYTYVYGCIMILGGYGVVLCYSMMLLCIHDLCHYVVAIVLHQEVRYIVVYPFGLSMEIESIEYSNSLFEMLIALAGPLSIYLSTFVLFLLLRLDIISVSFYEYLTSMNLNIFLFNSLPIYPLDGGHVLHALCHYFFNYKLAHILCMWLSFVFAVLFISFYDVTILYVYILVLGVHSILRIKNIRKIIREFHFYRYIRPCVSIIKIKNKGSILYRNYENSMVGFKQSELEYLRSIFMIHNRK